MEIQRWANQPPGVVDVPLALDGGAQAGVDGCLAMWGRWGAGSEATTHGTAVFRSCLPNGQGWLVEKGSVWGGVQYSQSLESCLGVSSVVCVESETIRHIGALTQDLPR